MITVKLKGGLGNQMFQYAFARNISLKYKTPLKIDLSFLNDKDQGPNFTYRNYDLDIFKIKTELNSTDSLDLVVSEPHFNFSSQIIHNIENFIKNKNAILLDGYWQTPFYFQENQQQIKNDFTFSDDINDADERTKSLLYQIQTSNSILINVRRTDYLNTNFHGVMSMDYFRSSKSIIDNKVDNPRYFIFSDDIKWCEDNFNFDNCIIVDHSYKGNKFSYYLQLMINCKHFIIPNSSFAWWAAWLSKNDTKIVISPKNWFNNRYIDTSDLIPRSWIRI